MSTDQHEFLSGPLPPDAFPEDLMSRTARKITAAVALTASLLAGPVLSSTDGHTPTRSTDGHQPT
jgi:hypothetical protein